MFIDNKSVTNAVLGDTIRKMCNKVNLGSYLHTSYIITIVGL